MAEKNPVILMTTSMGNIRIELDAEKAPITTKNFLDYVSAGHYDGLIFHRVIPDFMIQGGCPQGTGMGGPGYKFADEFHSSLKHSKAGKLSMANSGPNTNGSQFFITVAPTSWLDTKHTIFGEVIEGQDVANKISVVAKDRNDRPNPPVTIKHVKIERVG